MKTCNFKSRNAVSTIIGTFFFVIIMAGAFTAFILMMQTNSNFLNTQLGASQNEIEKIQGQFTIAAAYDDTGAVGKKLCVSVKNAGSTPLEIADLFIINKTNNEARQFDIDFRDAFVPASSIRQILTNQPITLRPGIHDIKVVSTSGITQTTELKVFATSSPDPRFNVTAFAYPVNAASGQNVTVGMHVFNRMNTTLINVQPNGDPFVDPAEAVSEGFNFVTTANITRLDPNESTTFMWEPEFVGGVGSKLNFTVRAKALVEGCTSSSYIFNSDSALVKVVPGVRKEILAKPEILVTFPNLYGESAGSGGADRDRGYFVIAILNPTNNAFKINQVAVQMTSPDNPSMVSSIVGVKPSSGWTPVASIVYWKGTGTSAVFVEPFGVAEFIVAVEPSGTLTTVPINAIFFNAYSTFGQFARGPFTVGTTSTTSTVLSVISKTTFSGTEPIFAIPDVPSGTVKRFNFTMANLGQTAISTGSYMLINVPAGLKDITNVTATAGQDGLSTGLKVYSMKEFDDGSIQIPVEIITTNLAAETNRTYSFRATMPTISVPAHYIITALANGTTTGSEIIGPLTEVVVQVCPASGCP